MRLRLRYSLLTMLVFTALVAGGVKLWYGPHHVVEQDGPNWEKEYSYTRDWRGNRVFHGPLLNRKFGNRQLVSFQLYYFRNGDSTDWSYVCEVIPQPTLNFISPGPCPLSILEQQEFHQARDAELQRIIAAGMSCKYQVEGVIEHGPGYLAK